MKIGLVLPGTSRLNGESGLEYVLRLRKRILETKDTCGSNNVY